MVNNYWRFMFGFPLVITAIQVVLMLTVFKYDTPKFLKMKQKYTELDIFMNKIYSRGVRERVDGIAVEVGSGNNQPTYKQTCCHPRYMYATIIGCVLSGLQQLSGINAVMFYSSTIF